MALTQQDLAERIGVTQAHVSQIENGRTEPSLYLLRALAEALNTQPGDLLAQPVELDPAVLDELLKRLRPSPYRSVFISYGGPDEAFARAIYDGLKQAGVDTFFFPESARPGQRLHRTMSDGVNEYDRVVLVCSAAALDRPGVLNELEQVLAREAREGGAELLIPVAIDDGVFDWTPHNPDLGRQLRDRVVSDFRNAVPGSEEFAGQLARLLHALLRT